MIIYRMQDIDLPPRHVSVDVDTQILDIAESAEDVSLSTHTCGAHVGRKTKADGE